MDVHLLLSLNCSTWLVNSYFFKLCIHFVSFSCWICNNYETEINERKNLDKKFARSEGKSLNMHAKIRFCNLEKMSNCIYHRAMFLDFEFLHYSCKLRLFPDVNEVTNWNFMILLNIISFPFYSTCKQG